MIVLHLSSFTSVSTSKAFCHSLGARDPCAAALEHRVRCVFGAEIDAKGLRTPRRGRLFGGTSSRIAGDHVQTDAIISQMPRVALKRPRKASTSNETD